MNDRVKKLTDLMRGVLKYSPRRAYFGNFVPQKMYDSYSKFKRTEKWNDPVTQDVVEIGNITGDVICRALWEQASYNPKRFGVVSPFMHNGRADIKYFYNNGVPSNFPGYDVWNQVREIMIEFMNLNDDPHCEDNGAIDTNRGLVRIKLINGFTNINYQKLSKLTEMIRKIISQNLQDLQRKPYREEMLGVVLKRRPDLRDQVREIMEPKPASVIVDVEEPVSYKLSPVEEERLDDAAESAQITLDNRKYVPVDQYEQALADIKVMNGIKVQNKIR